MLVVLTGNGSTVSVGLTATLLSLVLSSAAAPASSAPAATCDGGEPVTERNDGEHLGSDDLSAHGDFDGDGHIDRAFFVQNAGVFLLVVCLGDAAPLTEIHEVTTIASYGIRTAPLACTSLPARRAMGPLAGRKKPWRWYSAMMPSSSSDTKALRCSITGTTASFDHSG